MVAPGLLLLLLILLCGVAFYFWAFLRIFGRSAKATISSILIFVAAALFGPLLLGAWLPDLFFGRVHLLASTKLDDGTDFRVTQYWGGDFYTTELWITFPDGRRERETLDGDDNKSWHIPLSVDPANRTVTVVLSGNRQKITKW